MAGFTRMLPGPCEIQEGAAPAHSHYISDARALVLSNDDGAVARHADYVVRLGDATDVAAASAAQHAACFEHTK